MVAPATVTSFIAQRIGSDIVIGPPVRLTWQLTRLATNDGHELNIQFSCTARAADSKADRAMVAETFLSQRDTLTPEVVQEHLQPALHAAVAPLSGAVNAADATQHEAAWREAAGAALRTAGFACGIEILPPMELRTSSPTLARQRLEAASHVRASQSLQRATEVLAQFQQLRQSSPNTSAGQLLEHVGVSERGAMLPALLRAWAEQSRPSRLLAVAGNTLMEVDLVNAEKPRLIPLPATLGPLRSVQPAIIGGQSRVLIGAQRGVVICSIDAPQEPQMFSLSGDVSSPLGFNRVASVGGHLFATHSQLGLVSWTIDEPPSARIVASVQGARNLCAVGGQILFTVAGQVMRVVDGKQQSIASISSAEIVGLVALGDAVCIVHADGALAKLEDGAAAPVPIQHRQAAVSAAASIDWLGETRLLLASGAGPIDCIGLSDSMVGEFCSGHLGFKRVVAAADWIAGLSPDRQRIVLWRPWDGQRSARENHIASQVQHRVADLALI